MKVDTRDKKPKVYSIAVISAVAVALFARLALHGGDQTSLYICMLIVSYLAAVYLYAECMLSGAAIACLLVVRHDPPPDRDFLIVLGCGLRADGTPTPLLRGRLDRAFSFWQMQREKAGFSPILITSGGQGSDEVVPESTAMKNYLVERGVPEEQIIEEDQSTSTFENMKCSKAKIEEAWSGNGDPRIGFSTTNYHEFRSGIYARRVKMRAEGICAPTKWYFWPNAWVREFVGIVTKHRGKQALVLGGMICFYVVMSLIIS